MLPATRARKERRFQKALQVQEALNRAQSGKSMANYASVFTALELKGIPLDDIRPRENVLTFDAWLARGRCVKKGEHGAPCIVWVSTTKKVVKEDGSEEEIPSRYAKTVYVFHESQTYELDPKKARRYQIS